MEKDKVKEFKEYRSKKKKARRIYKILWLTVLLIILVLIMTFIYIYGNIKLPMLKLSYPFTKEPLISKKEVYKNPNNIEYSYCLYKDNIILVSKDGVKAINTNGEEKWTASFTMGKPLISFEDEYLLIADKNGREINLFKNNTSSQRVTIENEIISAKINGSGYFCVITNEKGYKGKVMVFNNNLEEMFIWHSEGNYILDADISKDGRYLAISILNSDANPLSGGIMYFDTTNSEPKAAIDTEDNIIFNIDFLNSHVVGTGDKESIVLSEEGLIEYSFEYEGMEVVDFEKDDENNLLAVGLIDTKKLLKSDNSKILVYNADEKSLKSFSAEFSITNIDLKEKYFLYNSKRDIEIMDTEGNIIMDLTYEKDIKDVVLFNNKREMLVVVNKKELDLIELNRRSIF